MSQAISRPDGLDDHRADNASADDQNPVAVARPVIQHRLKADRERLGKGRRFRGNSFRHTADLALMRHGIFGKRAVDILADADEHSGRKLSFGKIFTVARIAVSATGAQRRDSSRLTAQRGNNRHSVALTAGGHLPARFHHIAAKLMPRNAGKRRERHRRGGILHQNQIEVAAAEAA